MVSIVIPVYNVETYLNECIDSVINQTYTDLEVILVDDGSTDNSPAICDSYEKNDKRVHVIHKPNGGLSDARNVGTTYVTGEYIFYLDSDDYIQPDTISSLVDFALRNECDIVQSNFWYQLPIPLKSTMAFNQLSHDCVLTEKEAMKQLIINDIIKNFAWDKLYKSSLVIGEKFPVGKFFEDSYWQHRIIDKITKYGIVCKPLYHYRQRNDSISGRITIRNIDLLEGLSQRLEFINIRHPELTELSVKYLFKTIWSIEVYLTKTDDADLKKSLGIVKSEIYEKYENLFNKYLKYNIHYMTSKKFPRLTSFVNKLDRTISKIS